MAKKFQEQRHCIHCFALAGTVLYIQMGGTYEVKRYIDIENSHTSS